MTNIGKNQELKLSTRLQAKFIIFTLFMKLIDKVNTLIEQLSYNPLYDDEPDIDIGELIDVLKILKHKVYCLECSKEHEMTCITCSLERHITELEYKIDELERLIKKANNLKK